jgi:hypothetical protein
MHSFSAQNGNGQADYALDKQLSATSAKTRVNPLKVFLWSLINRDFSESLF